VIWRFAILLPYGVLAAVVAVAYGLEGLATLMYFYFVAGVWLAFVLAWGSLARTAGRRNAERVWRTGHWQWSDRRPGSGR
jgi:cation transporter-like permease